MPAALDDLAFRNWNSGPGLHRTILCHLVESQPAISVRRLLIALTLGQTNKQTNVIMRIHCHSILWERYAPGKTSQ